MVAPWRFHPHEDSITSRVLPINQQAMRRCRHADAVSMLGAASSYTYDPLYNNKGCIILRLRLKSIYTTKHCMS